MGSIKIKFDSSDFLGCLNKYTNARKNRHALNVAGNLLENRLKRKTLVVYNKVYKKDVPSIGKKSGDRISTGETMKSIQKGNVTETSVVVGASMEYNPYTEKGTRFMAAEPIIEPTFNECKNDVKNIFVNEYKKV